MTLTTRKVRDAKPGDRNRIVWDGEVKGLGLRITKAGVKAFVLSYRSSGRKRQITLGRISELSLEKARELAGATLLKIRSGIDPLEERKSRLDLPTMSEGLNQYLEQYIPDRLSKGRLAPRTASEYTRQIEKNIRPILGDKRIANISRGDIETVLDSLPGVMANRVSALLSALFNLFEYWEYRPQHTNPVRGIEKSVEEARDRTFSSGELSALGTSLGELEQKNPSANLAIKLAAVTGLRIGEITGMRWTDIDFERGVLVLPKTKTGRRTHTLPSIALTFLANTRQESEFVIAGRLAEKPMNYTTVHNHWTDVCRHAGISGVRIHDLRRTMMTDAASLGVGTHLLRDMLGHKTTAMADRYTRSAGAPLNEIRNRMGEAMAAKLSGKPSATVSTLLQKV